MDLNHFSIPEADLPGMLGIGRDELRGLRQHLADGVDWAFLKKQVRYTPDGVNRLRSILKLPLEPVASIAEEPGLDDSKKTAPAEELVTLLVWQRVRNSRILEAYLPGSDPAHRHNILRVRVRDSKNFVRMVNGKPMELKARHLNADLYELATPCPRWKGRW